MEQKQYTENQDLKEDVDLSMFAEEPDPDDKGGAGSEEESAKTDGGDEKEAGTPTGGEKDTEAGKGEEGVEGREKETPSITESQLQKRLSRQKRKHERELKKRDQAYEDRFKALEESVVKANAKPEPQEEDFETFGEYIKTLTKWQMQQGDTSSPQEGPKGKTPKVSPPTDVEDIQDSLEDMLAVGKEKYKDWDDVVVTDAEKLPITVPMATALSELDSGADLTYFLGKNPKEAKRISKLSPTLQLVEIGRLNAMFDGGTTVKGKQKINPVKPVGPGAQAKPDETNPEKMSYKQYRKYRGYDD